MLEECSSYFLLGFYAFLEYSGTVRGALRIADWLRVAPLTSPVYPVLPASPDSEYTLTIPWSVEWWSGGAGIPFTGLRIGCMNWEPVQRQIGTSGFLAAAFGVRRYETVVTGVIG